MDCHSSLLIFLPLDIPLQVEPPGYPAMGFYCSLHGYQRPKISTTDGSLTVDPVFEKHLRRTSFVAPETSIAVEMTKSRSLMRTVDGNQNCVLGLDVVSWLMNRKGMSEESAKGVARRMLSSGLMSPIGRTPNDGTLHLSRQSVYRMEASAIEAK